MTATYAVSDKLALGLEYNPEADDLGLLANWRVLDETETRPALILGTSSDRIGTRDGRAYFATLSKNVEGLIGLPLSPYVGAAFGEADDEWELIGGTQVRWAEGWSSSHLYDGRNLHHVIDRQLESGLRIGLVIAEQDGDHYAGISLGTSL